jgi:hypothetical protein
VVPLLIDKEAHSILILTVRTPFLNVGSY